MPFPKMNRILEVMVILTVFFSFETMQANVTVGSDQQLPGVVFSSKLSEQLAREGDLVNLEGPYWTPTTKQIIELEKVLRPYVNSHAPKDDDSLHGNLSEYKRQYIGMTFNGKQVIFVNAFCDSYWLNNDDWKSHFVLILDGGPCFFQIIYDPESRSILQFLINGYA